MASLTITSPLGRKILGLVGILLFGFSLFITFAALLGNAPFWTALLFELTPPAFFIWSVDCFFSLHVWLRRIFAVYVAAIALVYLGYVAIYNWLLGIGKGDVEIPLIIAALLFCYLVFINNIGRPIFPPLPEPDIPKR